MTRRLPELGDEHARHDLIAQGALLLHRQRGAPAAERVRLGVLYVPDDHHGRDHPKRPLAEKARRVHAVFLRPERLTYRS